MHQAMKSGEKVRLGALRLLTAAIKNREIEVRHELTDEEVREIAGKEVKKRTESIEAFDAAGRTSSPTRSVRSATSCRSTRPRSCPTTPSKH